MLYQSKIPLQVLVNQHLTWFVKKIYKRKSEWKSLWYFSNWESSLFLPENHFLYLKSHLPILCSEPKSVSFTYLLFVPQLRLMKQYNIVYTLESHTSYGLPRMLTPNGGWYYTQTDRNRFPSAKRSIQTRKWTCSLRLPLSRTAHSHISTTPNCASLCARHTLMQACIVIGFGFGHSHIMPLPITCYLTEWDDRVEHQQYIQFIAGCSIWSGIPRNMLDARISVSIRHANNIGNGKLEFIGKRQS